MKKSSFGKVCFAVFMLLPVVAFAATAPESGPETRALLTKASKTQVPFVANAGQVPQQVDFYARTLSGMVFVEKDGTLTYRFPGADRKGAVIKEVFTGSTVKHIRPAGLDPSETRVNYFKGSDKGSWKTNIPNYDRVSLGEIYQGIQLSLKAYGNNVEKLFTVLPGQRPETIAVQLQGTKGLQVDAAGRLEAVTEVGIVKFTRPVAFQEIGGIRKPVQVAYALREGTAYGFSVGPYDTTRPLVIDPLIAATFLGTDTFDFSWVLDIDSQGNVYVSSSTQSPVFPVTSGAYDETYNGGETDIYVAKFSNDLSTLIACTYVGGSAKEQVYNLTLDDDDNVYATGFVRSTDFPTTPGAAAPAFGGGVQDGFVIKLDSSLSTLLGSTYLGGTDSDTGHFVQIDRDGHLVAVGDTSSSNFPTTAGAIDETHNGLSDGFVTKLNNTLTTILASTVIGGSGIEIVHSLTTDDANTYYLTGSVASPEFPVTPGAYDTSYNSGTDTFVCKVNSALTTLIAGTFFGGSGVGYGYHIAVNGAGEVYVAGETNSADMPTHAGAFDRSYNGNLDVFLARFSNDLSTLKGATFLGGNDADWHHHSMHIDGDDNVYVSGLAKSSDFPTTPCAHRSTNPSGDMQVFISKFDKTLSLLLASTLFGGESMGNGSLYSKLYNGNLFVTGWTTSADFPATPGAYDETYHGGMDIFVAKMTADLKGDDCDDGTPPEIPSITANLGAGGASIPLVSGACFGMGSNNIIWTSLDPGYPDDGRGWASRRGVEHTYFSYKPSAGTVWSPEIETALYGNPGFYGQWSWAYPVILIGADGDYDVRVAAEDFAGNRTEAVYQITIDSTDTDADGVPDCVDNCPAVCNPLQLDADLDGIGDLCDGDPGCEPGGCTPCEEECPVP